MSEEITEQIAEQVSNVVESRSGFPILVGVAAFGVGLAVGYFIGKRRKIYIPASPNDQPRANLAMMKQDLEQLQAERGLKEKPSENPKVIVTETIEQISDEESDREFARVNVFEAPDDDWDFEKETLSRSSSEPYILHKDEFYEDELKYTQTTITYYAGDDIFADEEDKIIYDGQRLVGELKFGHGSGDPRVFYVRNDRRKAEYEVLLHDGLFSEEVMGHEIPNNQRVKGLQHSAVPKFRQE